MKRRLQNELALKPGWVNRMLTLLCFFVLTGATAYGQTVSGTVSDENNEPLIGATVIEFGTTNGTVTDFDGNFSLTLSGTSTQLEVSYIGYETRSMAAVSGAPMSITLSQGIAIDEVVVTALGISREKKGLSYAVDEVSGDELSRVKDANVINSLAGKAPGVFINKSSAGVGGSTRVILRGNKSTTNNEPLYVIDGIPMINRVPLDNNPSGEQINVFGGTVDNGDGISNINPDDIESMSVLKGASAAALYGSQAANGVILITTKKGKSGKPKISFSSSYTAEEVAVEPELQYRYGQTSDGAEFSWGGGVNAADHVSDFFETGSTFINSLSISGGTDRATSYFSYANTYAEGVMPTNELKRHNVTFRQTMNFLDDRLNVNGSLSYISQGVKNRPGGGLYFNPLTGLYLFPRGLDFNTYKTNFEVYSEARNFNVQNWVADRDIQQNPWWILNRNQNDSDRDRYLASVGLSYKLTDQLSVQARGNIDHSYDQYVHNIYATTQGTLSDNNGRYIYNDTEGSQIYGDVIFTFADNLSDEVALDINVGASHTNTKHYSVIADSKNGDLSFANKFGLQYMKDPIASNLKELLTRVKKNAVFASAQLGYRSMLYLDVTARNDWSSALPNDSYFYPSVGVTAILTEMVDLAFLDFAKLRASYAQVGNDVPAYLANPKEQRGTIENGQLKFSTEAPLPGTELVPEESSSFEIGLDIRAVNNRLGIDLTYYKTNTKNQFISITAPAGSGFTRYLINAGDVQNSGIEARVDFDVIKSNDFNWNTSVNMTANSNEIIELSVEFDDNPDGPAAFFITNEAVNSYGMVVQKGGSFGDIWGERFARDDQGRIMLDEDMKPQKDGLGFVGNPNPDFMLGWANDIQYKDLSVSFLIDGRFGGEVLSVTEALLDEHGVSETTAAARDAGSVQVNAVDANGGAVSTLPADLYYGAVGGRQGISENYVYDATNIRLREVAIGYRLPNKIAGVSAKISLIGRNLFFFTNDAPFDPDVTASTGVGLQGIDIFSLPSTRSYGVNLTLDF